MKNKKIWIRIETNPKEMKRIIRAITKGAKTGSRIMTPTKGKGSYKRNKKHRNNTR